MYVSRKKASTNLNLGNFLIFHKMKTVTQYKHTKCANANYILRNLTYLLELLAVNVEADLYQANPSEHVETHWFPVNDKRVFILYRVYLISGRLRSSLLLKLHATL